MIEIECHYLNLIGGRGRGLESDQGEESPRNHHVQSSIIQILKVERHCVLKNDNTAGHFFTVFCHEDVAANVVGVAAVFGPNILQG